jgi:hypothetical protein
MKKLFIAFGFFLVIGNVKAIPLRELIFETIAQGQERVLTKAEISTARKLRC